MTKELIKIGIANECETTMDIEVLKTWIPKKINYFGDSVYFKNDMTFYSLKRTDFDRIFKTNNA